MSEATETWLTQEAFDRLQAELDDRSTSVRREITMKIEAAREEGDLKENGGYHAAKEDQGKNEARIRQLKALLENAKVGTPPDAQAGVVTHGTVVTVRYEDGDVDKFLLGSREEAATSSLDVYSPTSPLGAAILGAEVEKTVTYDLPNGKQMAVTIINVEMPS